MPARKLDGKTIAAEIRKEVADEVTLWMSEGGKRPTLAAVLVGDDPASQVYVRNKERACEHAGMSSRLHRLDAGVGQAALLKLIDELNRDTDVDGILVQLPLPRGYDEREVLGQ